MDQVHVKEMKKDAEKQNDIVSLELPTEEVPESYGSHLKPHCEKKGEDDEFSGASKRDNLLQKSFHEFSKESPTEDGIPSIETKEANEQTDEQSTKSKNLFGSREENLHQKSNPNLQLHPYHGHPFSSINQQEQTTSARTRSILRNNADAAIVQMSDNGAGATISTSSEKVHTDDRKIKSTWTKMSGAMATPLRDHTGKWQSRPSRSPSSTLRSKTMRMPSTAMFKGKAFQIIAIFCLCILLSLVGNSREKVIFNDDAPTIPTTLSPSIIKNGTTQFFRQTVTYHYPAERFTQLDAQDTPIKYVICVLADTHVREPRDAIRETWGRNNNRVFFGVAALTLNDDLREEFEQHQDLILIEKEETYENLAWKTMTMIHAVSTHLKKFEFIWKTDDDVYVRVKKLKWWLRPPNATSPSHLIGNCVTNAKVVHFVGSKWYVPPSAFPEKVFPPHSKRSYAISKELGQCIGREVQNMEFIAPEDALVGILARQCNYKCTNVDWPLFVSKPESNDPKSAMLHFGANIADGVSPKSYFADAHQKSCDNGHSLRNSCTQPVSFQHGHIRLFGEEVEYRFHNKILNGTNINKPRNTIVCVLSKATSSKSRDLIRKTWAVDLGKKNNVFFGVSGPFTDIEEEFGEYGDLIWVDRFESFDNRAWKVMTMFHVVNEHVPEYRYITKTDDDAYVNSKVWLPYLRNTSDPYVGSCKVNGTVNRNPLWRSYVPTWVYPDPVYPSHSVGGTYAISQGLSVCILLKAVNATYMSVENVLTAILAKDCGASCVRSRVRITKGTFSIGSPYPNGIFHLGYEMDGVDGQAKLFEKLKNQAH